MTRSTVATATEADWSFLNDDGIVRALGAVARRASREFEGVEYGDALHDIYLYLAVRPEALSGPGRDNPERLAQNIYGNVRRGYVAESCAGNRSTSVDVMVEAGGI